MAYSKKTWVGRTGTGLNKYKVEAVEGAEDTFTITSTPDSIVVEGDALSANNLNDLENRIDGEFTNVNNEITKLKDGTTPAKKAEGDEDGTNIKATYAKKADYVPKADIVDGLSSSDGTKVLSAKQGKALNDAKANRPSSPVTGDVPKLDANGDLVNSGIPADNVAQKNGYYQEMTVGDAEQLVASQFIQDEKSYFLRPSGGGKSVNTRRYMNGLEGMSVGWNQILPISPYTSQERMGVYYTKNNDGSWTIDGTANSFSFKTLVIDFESKLVVGHKYLISTNCSDVNVMFTDAYSSKFNAHPSIIWNCDSISSIIYPSLAVGSGVTVTNAKAYPVIIDLTAMFGSTIADAIYAMEQATTGAGVAFFRKYFPKSYYPYNAGSIISSSPQALKNRGFNQWDEEWEVATLAGNSCVASKNFIKVLPSTEYYMYVGNSYVINYGIVVVEYDANGNWVKQGRYYLPKITFDNPTAYIKIGVIASYYGNTYNHDICINISSSRNGEYEAYDANNYELDTSVEIRGVPSLENGELVFDGDVYKPNGDVIRRFGVYTFTGEEPDSYFFTASVGRVYYEHLASYIAKPSARTVIANIWCDNFKPVKESTLEQNGMQIGVNPSGDIGFCLATSESTGSISDLKTYFASHPTTIIYELETYITEHADPYSEINIVDAYGTEEVVDTRDVAVPVNVHASYPPNLRDKLQNLPDTSSENGDYFITQNNKQMALKSFHNANLPTTRVGLADQLYSRVMEEDENAYNFRTSAGGIDVGGTEFLDGVVGGTICWNQKIVNGNFPNNTDNVTTDSSLSVSFANNKATVTVIAETTSTASRLIFNLGYDYAVDGHKYLVFVTMKSSVVLYPSLFFGNKSVYGFNGTTANQRSVCTNIFACQKQSSTNSFVVYVDAGGGHLSENDTIEIENVMCFDLTAMFGSTIADYIASLESSHAGDGVAWFRKYFPKSYYAYHASTLESVNTSGHKMIGFNALDYDVVELNTAEFTIDKCTHLVAGQQYQFTVEGIQNATSWRYIFKVYDANGNNVSINGNSYIGDSGFTIYSSSSYGQGAMQQGANHTGTNFKFIALQDCYIRIGLNVGDVSSSTIAINPCLHLVWDGERDGEYEEYKEYNYPLDESVVLRGIPKLEDGNLVFDGDVYEPDGTVNRNKVVVKYSGAGKVEVNGEEYDISSFSDSGDILQIRIGSSYTDAFTATTSSQAVSFNGNVIQNPYQQGNNSLYCWFEDSLQRIAIKLDGLSSVSDYKTYFTSNPLMFVATLNTSTTEEAQPYTNQQQVDDFGTEEFIDYAEAQGDRDVAIPVGHNTRYLPNLKAKLEMAPSNPEDDGTYLVQHDDGVNSYVPFTDPTSRVSALETKVPAPPTTDGTYVLKVTVSSGTPSYSWVSQS